MENSDEEKKGVILFGRDISKIPCFRNTFLYAISGGLTTGLITFMFTSRVPLSTNTAYASFGVITLCYWVHCRYKFSQTKFRYQQIKAALEQHVMYEGTELEKEIKKEKPRDA